ncbi:MAG: BamA/TamA family outer membrane protein [Spirulinaceae cyanobacterium]
MLYSAVRPLLLLLGASSFNLLFANVSWGQSSVTEEVITAILEAPNLQESTQPRYSTFVNEAGQPLETKTELTQRGVDAIEKDKSVSFYFGPKQPIPTVLQGPTRPHVVEAANNVEGGFNVVVGSQVKLSENQSIQAEIRGGSAVLGADVSYTQTFDSPQQGVSANIFNQRSFSPSFEEGDLDVNLPNGDTPWVHRLGGGVEYFAPVTQQIDGAAGITYQRVSARDGVFSSNLQPVDEFGNQLTVSNNGQEDLLTLNLATEYDTRNRETDTTEGTRVRLGLDQAVPVGDASIDFTRLKANYTQYVPVSLFGFQEGPRTLVVNLQGGHMFGDVPAYEAFNPTAVGFNGGEIATSRSFIQGSAEYRFPVFSFMAFDEDIDVGGMFFVDYANSLGTQDEVIGKPGIVRSKPGEGFGYGLGFRADSPFGIIRIEFGLNDDGGGRVNVGIGERF